MVLLIILIVLLGFIAWLIFSPLVLEIDTRMPQAAIRWIRIGKARVWYDNEWWLSFRIFFYRKTIRFSDIKSKTKRIKAAKPKEKRKRKMRISRLLRKMIRVLKTFRLTEWQLAIDTGDYCLNAQLYPLNYLPHAFEHLHINFAGKNYFVMKMKNRPLNILYAYLR